MKDQLVSYKTAKLASEKNFDCDHPASYIVYGKADRSIMEEPVLVYDDEIYELSEEKGLYPYHDVSVPTQSLLQKWIREKHDIIVWLKPNNDEYNKWSVYIDDGFGRHLISYYIIIKGYEDALEAGLVEALKLIK